MFICISAAFISDNFGDYAQGFVLFQAAVHSYNMRFNKSWGFEHLRAALEICPQYQPLLRKIADLALQLPKLVTKASPTYVSLIDVLFMFCREVFTDGDI